MRKFLALALLLITFIITIPASYASNFTSAFLKLDSQSANTALSGSVCAKVSSSGAGTESKIAITFPSDFTISSTTSNWTTNTTNLPENSTAWPGIGATATVVSGKTVTFASSDLTTTNLYCFNFVGASSTTGSTGTDKTGTITSKNSSDTTINSTIYSVAIVSSSSINITASVDPQVSDLPIAIESVTSGTTFAQETTINYKITYGNAASTSIPLTVQAEWTQGTISGNPSPSVDILSYVIGSASNAYGSTSPVIDTVNRTITWTIYSIPASTTGQTVTFSLKTTSNYTGSSLVSFDVLARSTSGSTVTPDESVSQNYQYSAAPTSTPTPTSTQSTTTSTPTPTPIVSSLALEDISIRSISSKNAKIAVSTNNKATFTLSYGTSISSLLQSIKTLTPQTEAVIELSDLEANTDYYFKIKATDENGKTISSDIFTFKTAALSPIPTIDLKNIIVTSNDNILLSPQIIISNNLKTNLIVIPRQSVFTIQFSLDRDIALKSIQAIIRNKRVLGFSTLDEVSAGSNYVNLVEVSPGVYTGKIATPELAGQYEVYVRLIDFNGNILEQKVLDLSVTSKFKVLVKGTNTSVENARVLLYLYNKTTKTYFVISPQVLPIQNPIYSTPDGRYNMVLPLGRYKADISAIGYNPKTVEFEIDKYSESYPTVYLEKNFNILNIIDYYFDALKDAIVDSQTYLKQHAASSRLFDLSVLGGVFALLILSILSMSARTHVGLFYLPYFLIFKLMILLKKNKDKIVFGKVIDEKTKSPISRAIVNILTSDGKNALTSLKTNKLGEFYFNNPNNLNYQIQITKEGFEPLINSASKEFPIIFKLKMQGEIKHLPIEKIFIYFENFLGMGMESLILLGLLIQLYSIPAFGFLRVLPFIIITILNFILMFSYLYKPRALED